MYTTIAMMISVVSPVYNSASTLHVLIEEICKGLDGLATSYEIILVDDGSQDHSWEEIEDLTLKYPMVRGIRLARNFGQHPAILAGLEQCSGEWIVVMDCDLQDDPSEIPALYQKALEGFPIVTGSRTDRKDPLFKRWSSRLFWKTLSILSGTPFNHKVANFGMYHRDVIDAVSSMKESIPFFPAMVIWSGFKSITINVAHGIRHSGETSYSYIKMFRLAADILFTNSDKAARIMFRTGLFISAISFMTGLYYFYMHSTQQILIPEITSIMISIWFLVGLTLLILGILGSYLGNAFEAVRGGPVYIIEKKTSKQDAY